MTGCLRRFAMVLLTSAFFSCALAAQGWQHLGKVQHVEKLPDGIDLTSGSAAHVRITAFTEGVIRVRVASSGNFPKDFSWAVVQPAEPPPIKIEETETEIHLATGNTIVSINKSPLLITFKDQYGKEILADDPSLPMAYDGHRFH